MIRISLLLMTSIVPSKKFTSDNTFYLKPYFSMLKQSYGTLLKNKDQS